MRVVIAEDGVLFREGLAGLLRGRGVTVAAAVGDAPALLDAVAEHRPDAAIVDVRMPPGQHAEGVEAATRIRTRHPSTGVLLLSHHIETHHTLRLLADNARGVGYLLKDRVADADELVAAVKRVADGDFVVDPQVFARLLRRGDGGAVAALSGREREVLAVIAEGRSNAAVAERLGVAPKTVEVHVRSIFARLGLPGSRDDHRRVLAVLAYLAER